MLRVECKIKAENVHLCILSKSIIIIIIGVGTWLGVPMVKRTSWWYCLRESTYFEEPEEVENRQPKMSTDVGG